jgi:glycosyltransferase involved in cell wall biosynthesis
MFGKKVVLTSHGPNYKHLKWNKVEKLILKFFEGVSLRWSNVIIAVSSTIANEIKKNYHKDVVIIPNGVNILKPVGSMENLYRLNIKIKNYILSVGRLVPEKGFHDLITAFFELNLEEWQLVIVGDTDCQSTYSDSLKRSQSDKIIFTGFLTGISLQELYSHAGLFVLPSYYEGLAISLLEAMSLGLTCIASNIAGNRNINLPEENYFEVGNIGSLKATILKLINKKRDNIEIAAQINYIKENFSWDKIVGLTLEMYKKVLKMNIN